MDFVMALCTRVLVLAEGQGAGRGHARPKSAANPQVIEAYLGH